MSCKICPPVLRYKGFCRHRGNPPVTNVDYSPFIFHLNMWSILCWYRCWVMLHVKTYFCLNHGWNHIHFLYFPFLCKTLVILWTRHSAGINLCCGTAGCVCTLHGKNIDMIRVGILISTPWSCFLGNSSIGKGNVSGHAQWLARGSQGATERALSSVAYWYMVRFKTQSETFS